MLHATQIPGICEDHFLVFANLSRRLKKFAPEQKICPEGFAPTGKVGFGIHPIDGQNYYRLFPIVAAPESEVGHAYRRVPILAGNGHAHPKAGRKKKLEKTRLEMKNYCNIRDI